MYDLTLGQNGHFNQENQSKEPCFSMPRAFNQSEHFNQIEPKNHDFL
jgi:hypothetical protein